MKGISAQNPLGNSSYLVKLNKPHFPDYGGQKIRMPDEIAR